MRINVYEEELDCTDWVETVSKQGERFYGLRIWLKSPQEILDHNTPGDDDTSAVTFWARDLTTLDELVSAIKFQRAMRRDAGRV